MSILSSSCTSPNRQAKAVLCYLDGYDGIEASWCDKSKRYTARVDVAEWHNCRERGYVVMMCAPEFSGPQINIAFFEHRNSDEICAVAWIQKKFPNPPTIETAEFGNIYADKYDVSHSVPFGHAGQMADWVHNRLECFWKENVKAAAA